MTNRSRSAAESRTDAPREPMRDPALSTMMRRLVQPFVLTITGMLAIGYAYLAWRLTTTVPQRVALAIPFVMIWAVPVIYWGSDRRREGSLDQLVHVVSYVSMGWVSFALVLTLLRDAILLLTLTLPPFQRAHFSMTALAPRSVLAASLLAVVIGGFVALRGPRVRRVDIPISGLHRDLDGFTIGQLTDLHVGLFIRRRYVEHCVALLTRSKLDAIAVTGDVVDGSVEKLASDVVPLGRLAAMAPTFFVLGNHDCYSGPTKWLAHFRSLGMRVLLNDHETIARGAARIVIGGVTDPAAVMTAVRDGPRPDQAGARAAGDFRVLLAHNPKVAPAAENAGFDLQLSGHTHAGQFFPWTLAVKLVHAPHVTGLSRRGRMWVYVSPGTGTWGPPIRFGTQPEVTLIRLVRAKSPQ